MPKSQHNWASKGGALDKLAQKGPIGELPRDCQLVGVGASKSTIRKRPKKKFICQKLMLALIDIAKDEGNLSWEKKYRNALYCSDQMITGNGRGHCKYCKHRFCTICVSICKADRINRLFPVLVEWPEPQFVTLTIKAKKHWDLKTHVKAVLEAFGTILKRKRKKATRKSGLPYIGIRALEANFNPIAKTYNPHFHLIMYNAEMARDIRKDWIKYWDDEKIAAPYLQQASRIKDLNHHLKETMKYGTKIFTDPTMNKGKSKNSSFMVYIAAMHEINKAFDGSRLFSTFGFKQPTTGVRIDSGPNVTDAQYWQYESSICDYVNIQTGQKLTHWAPNCEMIDLLTQKMDVESK